MLFLLRTANDSYVSIRTRHETRLVSADNKVLDQFTKNLSSLLACAGVQPSQFVQSALICIMPPDGIVETQ